MIMLQLRRNSLSEARVVTVPNPDSGNFFVAVGGPGSGKTASRVLFNMRDWRSISPDTWIEMAGGNPGDKERKTRWNKMIGTDHHPKAQVDLNDPAVTGGLYKKYSEKATRFLISFIKAQEGVKRLPNILMETTGGDPKKVLMFINLARSVGYFVTVVFVTVPLVTAIDRNSGRGRKVNVDEIKRARSTLDLFQSAYREASDAAWEVPNHVPLHQHRDSKLIRQLK